MNGVTVHGWAQRYTPEEADRLVGIAPDHLKDEVRALIVAVNQAHDQAVRHSTPTGRWYHVSPHDISTGSTLVPGGLDPAAPTSGEFYTRAGFGADTGTMADMGGTRAQFVWLTTNLEDARFWAGRLGADHVYEVRPIDAPRPWNGTGVDGWVVTAATIVGRPNPSTESRTR